MARPDGFMSLHRIKLVLIHASDFDSRFVPPHLLDANETVTTSQITQLFLS